MSAPAHVVASGSGSAAIRLPEATDAAGTDGLLGEEPGRALQARRRARLQMEPGPSRIAYRFSSFATPGRMSAAGAERPHSIASQPV